MNKRLYIAFLVLPLLAFGCAGVGMSAGREGEAGKGVPEITQSFASKEVRSGETWKIYIKASDPQGEMTNFFVTVNQLGAGQYPLTMIRIKKENNKELSGYIYLHTSASGFSSEFVKLTLTVEIQDKSGKFSQPAVFPLFIHHRATQESPSSGVFKEQALGPVMIMLQSIPGGVNGAIPDH